MPFVTLQTALDHLRADAEDPRVQPMLDSAERWALERLDRNVYADQGSLDTAIAAAPAALAAAKAAYTAAMDVAAAITDTDLQIAAEGAALGRWMAAHATHDRAQTGIVVNADILAAILLKLEHLFEGADTETAAESLLHPHRRLGL